MCKKIKSCSGTFKRKASINTQISEPKKSQTNDFSFDLRFRHCGLLVKFRYILTKLYLIAYNPQVKNPRPTQVVEIGRAHV